MVQDCNSSMTLLKREETEEENGDGECYYTCFSSDGMVCFSGSAGDGELKG